MTTSVKQSAIAEARDQLFVDTADGQFLNIVTSNQGLDRPLVGFSNDDRWRALAKKFMVQPHSVRPIFARILETMVGPQFSRTATLSAASTAGDDIITVSDSSDLIQVGTLVLDPGLGTEESIDIVFKDSITNKLYLKSKTTKNHGVLSSGTAILKTDAVITDVTITLFNSSNLPVTGYPYPILLDKGTELEEIVTVSNNNTTTNVLTVSALSKNHKGFSSSFVQAPLTLSGVIGRNFIQLGSNKTRNFPSTGYIKINTGGGSEEVQFFDTNDIVTNTLQFPTVLLHNHSIGEPVDLLVPGANIATVNVLQQGIYWDIFDTTAREVDIYIPQASNLTNILNSSWIHGSGLAPFATTLAAPTLITDKIITLTSVSGLPTIGMILLNGSIFFYTNINSNQLTLTKAVGAVLAPGTAVSLYQLLYPGTLLQEGNPRDAVGAVQAFEFPGPYVYDPTQRAPSLINSALTVLIPPATRVASAQLAGVTNLEVVDASLWPVVSSPFSVKIGRNTGFEETRTIIDRTLKLGLSTTVVANPDSHTITATNTTLFPESDGVHTAGYRIIINKGGGNEEVAIVKTNTVGGPGTFIFVNTLLNVHIGGESIALVNDVLTFDQLLYPHPTDGVNPTTIGHPIEILINSMTVVDGSFFPLSGGTIWVNYGFNRVSARSRVTGIAGPIFALTSTVAFPTINFPYQIILGEGLATQEVAYVIANNTGLGQLTLSAATINSHSSGEYISFMAGIPETLEYTSRTGNVLNFSPSVIPESLHTIGELVTYSPGISIPPVSGFGYSLKMPPDIRAALQYIFDLGRAAGIKVIIINNR